MHKAREGGHDAIRMRANNAALHGRIWLSDDLQMRRPFVIQVGVIMGYYYMELIWPAVHGIVDVPRRTLRVLGKTTWACK